MESTLTRADAAVLPLVDYQTHPDRYRHYKLSFDGPVATLARPDCGWSVTIVAASRINITAACNGVAAVAANG